MKRKTVTVDDGRTFEVREMTFGEILEVRARGQELPYTWPVEQQFVGREEELKALGGSEVRTLAEAVYALTYGDAEVEATS